MKTENKTKESYEAPVIEMVEVMVEQGFQESGDGSPNDPESGKDGNGWTW